MRWKRPWVRSVQRWDLHDDICIGSAERAISPGISCGWRCATGEICYTCGLVRVGKVGKGL